jgi:uncharacterized membrane protein YhfC
MIFSLLVSTLLPIVLVVVLYIKKRISLAAVLVGALVFLVFQLLTRIPMLQMLSQVAWYRELSQNLVLIALFLSFTAGLFEEVGRYIGMRLFMKNKLQIKNGVAYGLGHGGFEAIVLVGLTYINNLVLSLAINSGQFESTFGAPLGASAELIRQQLINTDPYLFAVAGLERMMTLVVQVALSLVVLLALRRKNLIYLVYAILLHMLVDFVVVILVNRVNVVVSEAAVFVFAVIGLVFILRLWKQEETPAIDAVEVSEDPPLDLE